MHKYWFLLHSDIYSLFLSSDHLLDLVLGKSLELGASTDEFTAEVDVGNGSLSVELLEVGLNGGWLLVWIQISVKGGKAYLRSQSCRVCLSAQITSRVQVWSCVGFLDVDDWQDSQRQMEFDA